MSTPDTTLFCRRCGALGSKCRCAQKVVLAACFPGCGWNGEVAVDAAGKWTCPGCGAERQFKDHRTTTECEHSTIVGHLPYDGMADCCGCGRVVYQHVPKRGPDGPGAGLETSRGER